MGAVVIATPLLSDSAVVIAGTVTAGSMPVTYLQTTQPSDVARWVQPTQPQVIFNLGSAQSINLVILGYTNASSAATWRVRGATSQSNLTASPGYDSTSVTFWPTSGLSLWPRTHGFLWLSSPQTYQWWQIDVSDAANSIGYFQAGRCYICNAYQATRGVKLGGDIQIDEVVPTSSSASAHIQTGGGQKYPSVRVKTGRMKFTLDFLTEAEMLNNMYMIALTRGATKDVWAILDPNDTAHFMQKQCYGTMKTGIPFKYTQLSGATGLPLYSVDVELEELP